jgi:uncharacterized protein (TIGR02145 family)
MNLLYNSLGMTKSCVFKLILIFSLFSCGQTDEKQYLILSNNWMDKNLTTVTFQNGDSIDYIKNEKEWHHTKKPAYTYFDNDSSNINKFGLLYNWYAIADSRGICPKGWRVSNTKDWEELIQMFGGAEVAARYLKSKEFWTSERDSIIGNSGFKALPGGNRKENGAYNGILLSATFWTIDEVDEQNAKAFYMNYAHPKVGMNTGDKKNGLSCRCIKDYDQ